jgi:hypothetical protein
MEGTIKLWRELDPQEEAEFRQSARENYTPLDPISPLYHPVYRDECDRINDDYLTRELREMLEPIEDWLENEND